MTSNKFQENPDRGQVMLTYTKVRPVLHVEVTASVLKPDLTLWRFMSGWSHGPWINGDLANKNGDLPIENGDLPIENGDLPIENGDSL